MALLANKAAVVTGAGSGIGAASARRFAREGAAVVAADIRLHKAEETVEQIVAEGGTAVALGVDVAKAEQVAEMVVSRAVKQVAMMVEKVAAFLAWYSPPPITALLLRMLLDKIRNWQFPAPQYCATPPPSLQNVCQTWRVTTGVYGSLLSVSTLQLSGQVRVPSWF